MKKRLAVVAAAILLAGLLIWKLSVKSGFYYAGTIEATEVDVSSRLSSVISGFEVNEGDTVSAGQLLVKLDSEDLMLAADVARKDFDRAEKLYKEGSLSQESYDRTKYKRDDAAVRLSWSAVKSPIDGKVLTVYHEAGEWVSPGIKLLTLADLGKVWAYLYVPQPLVSKLAVGMQVKGYLPELGTRSFEGSISRINDEAEFTPKNVQTREERTRLVYGVKVIFPNIEGSLKPGMTIEVKLPD